MSDVWMGQNAEILRATIDGTEYTKMPESYIAQLLIELKEVIEQGGGGGGTTNYNGLSNKPQINNVTLQGNKTLTDLGINIPTIDSAISGTSENPVQNKVIKGALDGKQGKLTFDDAPTDASNNPVKSGGIYTALAAKQDTLTFDNAPTAASNNPVKSGGIYTALAAKQDTLSFDNAPTTGSLNPVTSAGIKTALANYYTIDEIDEILGGLSTLSYEVVNTLPTEDIDTHTIYLVPDAQAQNVYNQYLYISGQWASLGSTEVDLSNYYTKTQTDTLLDAKQDVLTFDNAPTASSNNPVKSGGVYTALASKQDTLTFDNTPTASSDNPVTSDGIKAAIDGVNNKLYCTIANLTQNNKGSMDITGVDLDTITTTGFYNAINCTHAPYTSCALIVCGYYQTGYCFQFAADISTGEISTRVESGGTWTNWTDDVYSLLADKQDKTLANPIIVEGASKTTVETALSAVNDSADKRLIVSATMPAASVDLLDAHRLYVGSTTSTYTKGTIYECQLVPESDPAAYEWVAISTAEIDLSDYQTSFTGTYAEWQALTSQEKAEYDLVYITDDVSGVSLQYTYIVAEG